jgi:hypothetical protein
MVRHFTLNKEKRTTTLIPPNRKYLNHIRRTPGPFTDPDATSEENLAQFEKFKIL